MVSDGVCLLVSDGVCLLVVPCRCFLQILFFTIVYESRIRPEVGNYFLQSYTKDRNKFHCGKCFIIHSYQTIQAVEWEIEISGNKMQQKTVLQKHARKGLNLISNLQFLTMLFILKTMGRDKRLEYAASFQNCYFFRLLYYAGTQYPIMGALRWELKAQV